MPSMPVDKLLLLSLAVLIVSFHVVKLDFSPFFSWSGFFPSSGTTTSAEDTATAAADATADTPTFRWRFYSWKEFKSLPTTSQEGSPDLHVLSFYGYIFNVTSGSEFYHPERGSYKVLQGREATRALAMSSLEDRDMDRDLIGCDVDDIDNAEYVVRINICYVRVWERRTRGQGRARLGIRRICQRVGGMLRCDFFVFEWDFSPVR